MCKQLEIENLLKDNVKCKPIKNYEDKYLVVDDGRIWSIKSNKFLSPKRDKRGYLNVSLWKDNKGRTFQIHRLVAEAFIPNPQNLPQVNHKDEVKSHNNVENLEWCTASYNTNYGTGHQRAINKIRELNKNGKPVRCLETGTVYPSASDAGRKVNSHHSCILRACNNINKTAAGYHWEWLSFDKDGLWDFQAGVCPISIPKGQEKAWKKYT